MNAHFVTELNATPLRTDKTWWRFWVHRQKWRLNSDLVFYSAKFSLLITVPKGFVTDFASVPRVPIVFTLTGDTAHRAATIHDFLYSVKGKIGGSRKIILSRKECDAIFYEAMRTFSADNMGDDEPEWRRIIMWLSVRIWGDFD